MSLTSRSSVASGGGAVPGAGPASSLGGGSPVGASPSARRSARSAWRDPRLAIGIAIVAVSVLLGARLLAGADDTVGVWAVRDNLPSGAPVVTGDLVRRDVGFSEASDADRYLSVDDPLPPGSATQRELGAGELLPRAALAGADGPGLVELPLSVTAEAVPVTVRAGSVVDVWVASPPDQLDTGGTTDAVLVFDEVTVLSVPRSEGGLGPSAAQQVIVGLPPEQEKRLPRALTRLVSGTVILTRKG